MRRVGLIGLLGASLAATSVSATMATATRPKAAVCGGASWRLMTLSDPDRAKVVLTPRATTIGAIVARSTPQPIPRRRTTSFQKRTWQVVAQIAEYRLVGNVLHLSLSDDNTYVDATIPAPACLPASARARSAVLGAWTKFTSDCGRPTDRSQPLGAVAYVTGVGSWSTVHTGHGNAPNGATLSPVTHFRFVAGCGA
jgi:hypothetical protein